MHEILKYTYQTKLHYTFLICKFKKDIHFQYPAPHLVYRVEKVINTTNQGQNNNNSSSAIKTHEM